MSLAVGSSASAYEAPANGWFLIDGVDSNGYGVNSVVVLRNTTTRLGASSFIDGYMNGGYLNCAVPVSSGDIVGLFYQGALSPTNLTLKFVYAEGEI